MAQLRFPLKPRPLPELRYVRAPEPIVFPEEEEVPEGLAHMLVRTFLFQLLRFALGPEHSVGSDQFVYWNASDPKRKLSPDVFVRLQVPRKTFGSWQTWENGGPPDLAVEIVSPHEGSPNTLTWAEKFARYHELGVKELVRFDPDAPEGKQLRAWDRVRGDLVERVIGDDRTPCLTLGLNWIVCPIDESLVGLRLVDDDGRLLLTETEVAAQRAETEAQRADAEARAKATEALRAETEAQRADAEARARAAAEARIRELEVELARRSSGTGPGSGSGAT
jgi:Uma2 family endonuclease